MSKFSKGDKARVISVDDMDVELGIKVGDIVVVDQDDSYIPYCVMANGKTDAFTQDQLEHYIEPTKEITLNGATYVLKEEPKPEHEWKFGDWVRHPELGVVFILAGVDEDGEVLYNAGDGDSDFVCHGELTYISTSEIPE